LLKDTVCKTEARGVEDACRNYLKPLKIISMNGYYLSPPICPVIFNELTDVIKTSHVTGIKSKEYTTVE
jgi:hypothetical protein